METLVHPCICLYLKDRRLAAETLSCACSRQRPPRVEEGRKLLPRPRAKLTKQGRFLIAKDRSRACGDFCRPSLARARAVLTAFEAEVGTFTKPG